MRKPVLPRILGLIVLYCLVFVVLVMVQFTKKGNFTRRINGMTISGQYLLKDEGSEEAVSENNQGDVVFVSGGASINFGGLEFNMRTREPNEAFVLIGPNNRITEAVVKNIKFSDDAANLKLEDGTELIFQARSAGGVPELWISGIFSPGISSIDIPVKLQRSSMIRETSEGNLNIMFDGSAYQFNRPVQIREKAVLSLNKGAASVSYRAIPEQKAFNPAVFADPRGRQTYNEAITQWREQRFAYWGRIISTQTDEDAVSAYCGEAVSRGNYKDAVASVSENFLASSQRGYMASVFTGAMSYARRVFLQTEQERISRISKMISEKSADLLLEHKLIEYLMVRGFLIYAEESLDFFRTMDASLLTYDLCPGVFEGYADVKQFRTQGDNPFERLTDQACNIFSGGIRRDSEKGLVLVFRGNTADIEYNLRLGRALSVWGSAASKDDWANLGFSLVMSVLKLQDNSGAVPASVTISESGGFSGSNRNTISAARIYRLLSPGEYYPHAVLIGSAVNGIWAWTAAASIIPAQENNVLDLAISFPAGETHYIMIRGIRPFEKIQIYNMDYHSDPQFERYDSSGWVYSAQDQVLTIKLKHRASVEHVKIFY